MSELQDRRWGDIVEIAQHNWRFTTGWSDGEGSHIYERRFGIKTKHNAETAMEASYQRLGNYLEASP